MTALSATAATPDQANRTVLEVDRLSKHFPVSRGVVLAKRVGLVRAVDGGRCG